MILTLIIFMHIKEGTISKEQIVPMKSDLFLIRTLDKYKKFMKKSMKTKITHRMHFIHVIHLYVNIYT